MARLYADEDFPHPVADALRSLGHDVVTALDAGQANQKIPDAQVLAHGTSLDRAVLTHNRRDYIRLHRAGAQHAGIIVCTHDADTEALAQRIHAALMKVTDLHGQLVRIVRT
jgi:predicted nuclease of predicted toxin-antitoxin system